MKPNNPFLISGYYSPEFFCDREQETVTILDALHNGRNVTLIAPRRMGKTGLIRHVFYRLKEQQPDIVTFYFDIYSTQTLGDFVRLFASTVLGQLDSAPQKALSRISQFIRSCRPVFTFDELTGVPKVTIDVAPAEEENTLKEIFEYLGSSEKRCYVAIDEFQQIAEYPEKGVEALLRSYIQFLPNVNFIFAGSKQHLMQEMFTSSKRPFYQSTQPLTIGPIQQDEYASFAIEQILSEYSYTYADMLKAYSLGQVRLLKAIAKEVCVKEVLAGDFISTYRLRAASSVSAALKKLLENELVYQTSDGYMIYDRFMGEWLRRQGF